MFGKDADCPLWRAPCKEHKCRWWVTVQGKHPQSEQYLNQGNCAMAWLPTLMLETAQRVRQGTASTDKVANEVKTASDVAAAQSSYLINGLKASFPVLHLATNMGAHLVEDRRDAEGKG